MGDDFTNQVIQIIKDAHVNGTISERLRDESIEYIHRYSRQIVVTGIEIEQELVMLRVTARPPEFYMTPTLFLQGSGRAQRPKPFHRHAPGSPDMLECKHSADVIAGNDDGQPDYDDRRYSYLCDFAITDDCKSIAEQLEMCLTVELFGVWR